MYYPSRVFVVFVFFLWSVLAATPAMSGNWKAPVVVDGATPITAEELSDLISEVDDLVLIDSRHENQHQLGSIAGSISLPDTKTTPGALQKLVPSKLSPVVFYCEGINCSHSMKAVKKAVNYGYANIFWFRGGIAEWKEKGFPVVKN